MPILKIQTTAGKSPEMKKKMINSLCDLVEIHFNSKRSTILATLVEIEEDFIVYDQAEGSDIAMVELSAFPGRTDEVKENLILAIYDFFKKEFGLGPNNVIFALYEVTRPDWGISGLPGTKF